MSIEHCQEKKNKRKRAGKSEIQIPRDKPNFTMLIHIFDRCLNGCSLACLSLFNVSYMLSDSTFSNNLFHGREGFLFYFVAV